ncbi:DUF2575 domain-containing protein [Metakosakonia massiliensis]|uniref:DUF2575 family protein n=1 Tax=Phytobacter massiliensis TaxID=1485952 RepID=UPI0008FFC214|nr:DUF2575 family protein [Phytobacter massiliensis]
MYDATLRSDGAGFYQLAGFEYSFSTIKNHPVGQFFIPKNASVMKSFSFLAARGNRRLTSPVVQGILGRFSLF